jgi:hypothetical protein
VNSAFPSEECFVGTYLLHASFGAFGSLLLALLAILLTVIYFDPFYNHTKPLSRNDGFGEFIFVLYKLLLVVIHTFVNVNRYQPFILSINFLFNIGMLRYYSSNTTYPHSRFGKAITF